MENKKIFIGFFKLVKFLIFLYILTMVNLSFSEENYLILESNYPLPRNNIQEVYLKTKDIELVKDLLEDTGDFEEIKIEKPNIIKLKRKLYLRNVFIKGNWSFWRSEVLAATGLIENYPISEDIITLIPIRLKQFYLDKGYPYAQINVKSKVNEKGNVNIWIEIKEGKEFKIEKINIFTSTHLDKKLKKSLLEEMGLIGETFSISKIQEGIDKGENYLRKIGYYDANLQLASFRPEHIYSKPVNLILKNKMEINLLLDLGIYYSIKFKGNKHIKTDDLKNLLTFHKEGISERAINDVKDSIEKFYKERGFLDAKVSYSIKTKLGNKETEITFKIYEGKQYLIKSINLESNSPEIYELKKRFLNKPLSLVKIKEYLVNLKNLYKKNGYVNAEYSFSFQKNENDKTVDLYIKFQKGKKLILSSIKIIGMDDYELPETPKIYNHQEVRDIQKDLEQIMLEKGYLHRTVLLSTKVLKETKDEIYISVKYTIKKGKNFKRDAIFIYGSEHLFPSTIKRSLYADDNGIFAYNKIYDNLSYLYQTYLFKSINNSVKIKGIKDNSKVKIVESYTLRDDKRGLLLMSVGYNTDEKLKLTGTLRLKNLFNYGFEASGYVNFSFKRILSRVSFGSRLLPNKTVSFVSFYKDFQYHRLYDAEIEGYGASLERFVNRWVRRKYVIERNYIKLSDIKIKNVPLKKYFITKLSFSLIDDHRDDEINPTSGYYFHGSLYKYFEDLEFVKFLGEFRYYYTLYKITFTQRFNGGYIWKNIDQIPLSERFYLGGLGTFRGFNYEEVTGKYGRGGKSSLIINNEVRFPLYKGFVYGFVFLDVGNVFEKDYLLRKFDTRETGGAGVYIPTPAGAFLIDYVRKLDIRKGEEKYKLEFSISIRF